MHTGAESFSSCGMEYAPSLVFFGVRKSIPASGKRRRWKGCFRMKKWIIVPTLFLMLASASALAQTAYVDNGSDPASRLNMRAAPEKTAASLGKFYTGVQVEIIASEGEWSRVRIGSGEGAVTGYMMTAYLAGDAQNVCPSRQVVSPYGTPAVVLRDSPSDSYDAVGMLQVGQAVSVLGVSGEFCYVLAADGTVGCLAADELR